MQPGDGDARVDAQARVEVVVMARCSALTARGEACRAHALPGSDRCAAHARPAPAPEDVAQIMLMLRAGNYLEVAARAAGVTVDAMVERPEVREQIAMALAEGEVRNVARIAAAAAESWQAAAWLLERQHPDRWGKPSARQDERPPAPAPRAADGLDELADKRRSRRQAAKR